MKHFLTEDDVQILADGECSITFVECREGPQIKTLSAIFSLNNNTKFTVMDGTDVAYFGTDLSEAVRVYNEI